MLNISLNKLLVQRSVSASPFFQKRSFQFVLSNSEFSRFSAPISFRSHFSKIINTKLSDAISGAVTIDGNIQHAATGNHTIQEYQIFYALNSFFLNCKSNETGGAFWSSKNDGVVSFEKCYFYGCQSDIEAGAIYIKMGSLHLFDCTFCECRASAGAQAFFVYGEPRYIVKVRRTALYHCPKNPPFSQGSAFCMKNGDQYVDDLNITDCVMVSGAGGFKSQASTLHHSKNVLIQLTTGTATIIMTDNIHRFEPLTIDNVALINNTCDREEIIACDTNVYVTNAVLFGNYFAPTFIITPSPSKNVEKLKFGGTSAPVTKTKKKAKTPKPTKLLLVKYENAAYDNNHPDLHQRGACNKCNQISDSYSVYPIVEPVTPGIKSETPLPPPLPFNKKILILGPFVCLLVMLIGIILSSVNVQDVPNDTEELNTA